MPVIYNSYALTLGRSTVSKCSSLMRIFFFFLHQRKVYDSQIYTVQKKGFKRINVFRDRTLFFTEESVKVATSETI